MWKRILLPLVLMFLFCAWPILSAQQKPNLDRKIYEAIREHEPEWGPAGVIDNSLGGYVLFPGRLPKGTIGLGDIWLMHRGDKRALSGPEILHALESGEVIIIHLYEVASPTEAAQWLNRLTEASYLNDLRRRGWEVTKYEAADEAYVIKYDGERKSSPNSYGYFRKGKIVGEISGKELSVVERFTTLISGQMPAS
jgi:hypothetical protein